ncbi:hypothetical protein SEA_DALANDE_6 [Gordonia phage DalanDe]|nr:hypothetical protein SEA_DALANDE_6 [Gordonia phage DalanDe]
MGKTPITDIRDGWNGPHSKRPTPAAMETYNRLIDAMPVEDGGIRIEADDNLTLGINRDGSLDVILLDHHLHEVRSSPVTPPPRLADAVQKAVDEYERVPLYNDDGSPRTKDELQMHAAAIRNGGDELDIAGHDDILYIGGKDNPNRVAQRITDPMMYGLRNCEETLGHGEQCSRVASHGGPHHTLTPCDMFEGLVGRKECFVCGWPVSRHAS